MDVVVRGRNVPSDLRRTAERKLERLERMVRDVSRAEVDFSEEHNPRIACRYRCAVIVHRRHAAVTAHAAAPLPEVALDLVVDKVRHQVTRHKGR
ncbi:MAG TPA: ribosome-associated translation inhibitor RaiA [Acidimicrobiia bacterium]|nr:ribosome-associated translation inhibitor RaiA [Acidimicrobiia bacterium]